MKIGTLTHKRIRGSIRSLGTFMCTQRKTAFRFADDRDNLLTMKIGVLYLSIIRWP